MKILLTGACGYIGSHTALELLDIGFNELVVVDNLSNSTTESLNRVESITGKTIKFYHADITNKNLLFNILQQEMPHSIIHFAGMKAVGESVQLPLKYYENNVLGTIHLLNCMKQLNLKNLIFSSSATVYGNPNLLPIPETANLSTSNPYGSSKLMIENICRDICHSDPSWNITLLRYFNPIGAHQSGRIGEDPNGIPNNLVPYIAQVAVGKLKKLLIYGNNYPTPDGTGVRDYIHVVDLAHGHIKALQQIIRNPNNGLKIYNLGTGKGCSVLEVLKAYQKSCGKEIPYQLTSRRAGDIAECYADPSLAKAELGWQATLSLEEMTADSWRWQKQNPNGYILKQNT